MAHISITLDHELQNGEEIKFIAPCDCTEIEGLFVSAPVYVDGPQEGFEDGIYLFKDAHGNEVTNLGNLFRQGALVKVILDTEELYAYIQNASTNSYLEQRFSQIEAELETIKALLGGDYTSNVAEETEF